MQSVRTLLGRDSIVEVMAKRPLAYGSEPIVVATPRLGIDFAGSPWTEVPWRFAIAGHPSVSGPRTDRRPGRGR